MEAREKLILYKNDGTHREYLMPDESPGGNAIIFVGRGENNEIRTRSLHVSKRHCAIKRLAGRYYVTDFGSANGVRVRGSRIPAFVDVEVFDEDVVEGPDFSIRCRLPARSLAAGAPVPGEATERTAGLFAKARALANAPWTPPEPPGERDPAPHAQAPDVGAQGVLLVRRDGRTVATHRIAPPSCVVGIDPSCELELPATPGIDARHLAITPVDGRHYAIAYAPGVILNERCAVTVEAPVVLQHGDELRLGPYVLACLLPAAPPPPGARPSVRFDRTRLLEVRDLDLATGEPGLSPAARAAGDAWDSTPAAGSSALGRQGARGRDGSADPGRSRRRRGTLIVIAIVVAIAILIAVAALAALGPFASALGGARH